MSVMAMNSDLVTVQDSLQDLTQTTGTKLTQLEAQVEAIRADDSVINLSNSVEQLVSQIKQIEVRINTYMYKIIVN